MNIRNRLGTTAVLLITNLTERRTDKLVVVAPRHTKEVWNHGSTMTWCVREDFLLDKVRHILHVSYIGHQGWPAVGVRVSFYFCCIADDWISWNLDSTTSRGVVLVVRCPRSCLQTETVHQSDTVTIPRGIYRQGRSELENDGRKSHNLLLSTLNHFWTS